MLDATSPAANGLASKPGLREGTVRFMLDAGKAREEKMWVEDYFKVVEEEYTIEVPVEKARGERDRRRG